MKELFLSAFLLCEELNIVDQQDVDIPELVAEAGHLVISQRIDHFVRELLAGDVADSCLRHCPLYLVPNGLHEMGLAHANTAVQEQRVVGLRRTLRDGLASRVGELVTTTDDKAVKGITGVELGGAVPTETRLRNVNSWGSRLWRGKPAIVPHWRRRRIILRGDELN